MIVTVDLETYYSSDYSLSKMTEIDYILDPRFEFICCSVKVDDQPVQRAWGQAAIEALLRPCPGPASRCLPTTTASTAPSWPGASAWCRRSTSTRSPWPGR